MHLRNLTGQTGTVRTTTHQGRPTLVVPVVALVGDIAIRAINAPTYEYVPLSTLSKEPERWRGKPVVLEHPKNEAGQQISANSPSVLERHGLGTIAEARIDKGRLCLSTLIDIARAEKLGGAQFLQRLRNGEQMECSIGAYVTTSPTSGIAACMPYEATWESIVPDHVAVLPHSRGACSTADGCGFARAAAEQKMPEPPDSYSLAIEKLTGLKPPCPYDDPRYVPSGMPPDPYLIAIERQKKQGEQR